MSDPSEDDNHYLTMLVRKQCGLTTDEAIAAKIATLTPEQRQTAVTAGRACDLPGCRAALGL